MFKEFNLHAAAPRKAIKDHRAGFRAYPLATELLARDLCERPDHYGRHEDEYGTFDDQIWVDDEYVSALDIATRNRFLRRLEERARLALLSAVAAILVAARTIYEIASGQVDSLPPPKIIGTIDRVPLTLTPRLIPAPIAL